MIQLFSPAKINLFFKLVGKRPDGFHNLESLFQTVNLGDTLSFEISNQDRFTSTESTLGFNDDNFIIKALFLFRSYTKILTPVAIHLEKRIPMLAGLGGGSSNIATTLYGLNELFHRPVSEKTLFEWSKELASDAPFFFSKGTALCEGKGEKVRELPPLHIDQAWLVKPSYGMSTAEVYKSSKKYSNIKATLESMIKSAYTESPHYENDLEEAAFKLNPSLQVLKQELLDQKFQSVVMTGSGSTFVCIGKNKPKVKNPVQIFPIQYINRPPNQWYKS